MRIIVNIKSINSQTAEVEARLIDSLALDCYSLEIRSAKYRSWQESLELNYISYAYYTGEVDKKYFTEFKFVLRDKRTNRVYWQDSYNIYLNLYENPDFSAEISIDLPKEKFKGIALPLFSLRSRKSLGIGDFNDLKLLLDFSQKVGINIVQLLPVNNTTLQGDWQDSYPYNCLSAFALHPQYLHLPWLGKMPELSEEELNLEDEDSLDYPNLNKFKNRIIRYFFERFDRENSPNYTAFVEKNSKWLMPYALFSHFRDIYSTSDYRQWGEYSVFDMEKMQAYAQEHEEELAYYYYEQYQLHIQFKAVADYAAARSILIKGDLPIGVAPYGVDTWQYPQLFNLDFSVGAPPDAFSTSGQNWGFPSYNWEEMEKDNFSWWRDRLERMAEYFSAYRIDHVLGFFRIWEIPRKWSKSILGAFYPNIPISERELLDRGFDKNRYYLKSDVSLPSEEVLFIEDFRKENYYNPRINAQQSYFYTKLSAQKKQKFDELYYNYFYHWHEDLWYETAKKRLSALLSASKMIPCAEDLGMIPACVSGLLRELNILSLEIERMPKEPNRRYADTQKYPYLSVASPGTHDMPNIRKWWLDLKTTGRGEYLNTCLNDQRNFAPFVLAYKMLKAILRKTIEAPSAMSIIPLQDYLALSRDYNVEIGSDRINDPANPNQRWEYRMPMTLESLMEDHIFMRRMIEVLE